MKASIMTFSQTGNTLKVGTSIGHGLQNEGFEIEHVNFRRLKNWNPEDADIIGIGAPCFEFSPPECLTDFLENTTIDFSSKKVFVFITSSGLPMNTLWKQAEAVLKKGATVIGGIQIIGMDNFPTLFGHHEGRPNKKDLALSEKFGKALAANIKHGTILPKHFRADQAREGKKLGDFLSPIMLYVKKKTIRKPKCDLDKCVFCGNCVFDCPTKTIKIRNKTVTFGEDCIQCYRCWHICPENAIDMRMTPFNGYIERKFLTGPFAKHYGDTKPGEDKGPNLYKEVISRKIKLKFDRKNPTAEYEYVDTADGDI